MDIKENKNLKICRMFQYVVKELVRNDWLLPPAAPHYVEICMKKLDKKFSGNVSDGRIVNFIVYQIYRYRDLIAVKGSSWNISWCFSDKAIQKFMCQFMDSNGKSGMMYYIDCWLRDGDMDRSKLEEMIVDNSEHRLAKYIYIESEDATKRRFLNTEFGLHLCLTSTTGWTPQSPVCIACSNATQCISASQKKCPELIRLRKESQK